MRKKLMLGLITSTINAYKAAKEVYDVVKENVIETYHQSTALVKRIYRSKSLRKTGYDFLIQSWTGYFHPLEPENIVALAESPQTRRILLKSAVINLGQYFGIVLTYEMIRNLLRTIPDMENSTPEQTMDYLALIFLMRISLQTAIDNLFLNACITKTSSDENKHDIYNSCNCESTSYLRAGLASIAYYGSNMAVIKLAKWVMPGGDYIEVALGGLAYGQAFVEFTLAERKLCTSHRYEIIKKNNAYCFGLGMSFLTAMNLSMRVVENYTGVKPTFFMYNAVFNFLFQYYIFLAMTISKPLPGKSVGFDYFKLNRLVAESLMKDGVDFAIGFLGKKGTPKYSGLKNLSTFPPIKLSRKIFLGKEYDTIEQIVKQPTVSLALDLYRKQIQDETENYINTRNTKWKKWIARTAATHAPRIVMSEEMRTTFIVGFHDSLEGYISDFYALMIYISGLALGNKILTDDGKMPDIIEDHFQEVPPVSEKEKVLELDFDKELTQAHEEKNPLVVVTDLPEILPAEVEPKAAEPAKLPKAPVTVMKSVLMPHAKQTFAGTSLSLFDDYDDYREGKKSNTPTGKFLGFKMTSSNQL